MRSVSRTTDGPLSYSPNGPSWRSTMREVPMFPSAQARGSSALCPQTNPCRDGPRNRVGKRL